MEEVLATMDDTSMGRPGEITMVSLNSGVSLLCRRRGEEGGVTAVIILFVNNHLSPFPRSPQPLQFPPFIHPP
jgi:hypothetical protein